ncbi:uncharacterized protein LOC124280957 [Haliotis rubra]|uniref:uncharacterized protein LOC124280957 n=1 Tax=Haliotis rubra TaxID=36100 RepID=UPI001EE54C11|nr:uncharacterized protein LOC124280957 [Haliotis rubra]
MSNSDNNDLEEIQYKQDDKTAKKKCIRILKEMEFRCMNSAIMNYELSSHYDNLQFRVSVFSSIAAGIITLPASKVIPAAQAMTSLGSKVTKLGMVGLLCASAAAVAYSQAAEYLLPSLKRKMRDYNKAGAGWQRLELNIRGFLASSTVDQTTVCEYRAFIEQCGEKREEICNIARPEEWSYKKYNETCSYVIDRYRRRNQWHMEFRKLQKVVDAMEKTG